MLLSIVVWIVVGVLTGWMASVPFPMEGQVKVINRVGNGLVGALAGGLVVYVIGFHSAALTDFNLFSVIAAFVGAAVLAVRGQGHVAAKQHASDRASQGKIIEDRAPSSDRLDVDMP